MVVLSATVNASETPMADTIKTGTTLIEEGTLMLESLQFESEPWTSFYMAGEIIRESRKASGKQSQYGSEGDKAHSDNVIDHDDHPRDVEEVEFKTFGCGSAIASSSLATEWVKGKSSRKALGIKNTNIVCAVNLPPCKPARRNKILQNWGEATPGG